MATAKPLIIAEKPSAARAIAEALGGFARRDGYLESDQFMLAWAVGHLVELMAPEDYDGRWKRWSLETLPIDPTVFGLKVTPKTKGQYDLLVRLGKRASELINACDAGREGELIFRYITESGGLQLPVRRLWVSSLTREAVRKGFAELRQAREYDRLYQSALCRARGDWLVGMNATRAFTVKWGELFSVGRVQTPTLALLVRREQEIEAFVPEIYWQVEAGFETQLEKLQYRGRWFGPDGDRIGSAEAAQAVADRVRGRQGLIESVEEKPVAERPPQLFDLTSLQREANRRLGLTAAATLKAAQSLYERKLITYPRTDSRHITRDLLRGLPAVVKALAGLPEFSKSAAGADLRLVHPGNRRVVDESKVTDHHAILPTAEVAAGLSGVDAKVYGLIARRFLAQFYPEARYLETEVITRVGEDRFRSKGRRLLEQGWLAVEGEPRTTRKKGEPAEEESPPLPALKQGESVRATDASVLEKSTQPPKRYSEATLLSAMEFAGRELDDDALKEAMKGRGLGTPATRASIIERLKQVGYITAEKKLLVPTPKGRQLVERAEAAGAQVLLSPELTGEWEKRISDIQQGGYAPELFMAQIRDLARQVVDWVRAAERGAPPVRRSGAGVSTRSRSGSGTAPESAETGQASQDQLPAYAGKCPRCGRAVVKGRKGWTCANSDCGLELPGFLCGKVVDGALAGAILERGRSPLITGFKSPRTGKSFSAFLVLKGLRVEFEFPVDRPRKASGYRKPSAGGGTGERATAAKAGSRKTGGGAVRKGTGAGKGGRVGGGSSRSSKPARTGPQSG